MCVLSKDLNPAKEYSFQTSPSGRTHPMTVKQFLKCSHANEELITVDDGFGPDSTRVWSTYDGLNVQAYADLVGGFFEFINSKQDVNSEFIICAIGEELTVAEAVASWFFGTSLSVKVMHHSEGSSGLLDIDIEGVSSVRRVLLRIDIKKGDMFNIYYCESSKGGGIWDTDLVTTLNNCFQSETEAA